MHLSVVIPTFNRAKLLVDTIPALLNQRTTDFSYEVIFVSNGSTDISDGVLKDAAARNPEKLRYFYIQPTGGPSAPRNVGIRAATGNIVIILDDDVLPDNDLVLRYAEFHKQFPELHHAAIGEAYVPASVLVDPLSVFHSFPYNEVRNLDRLSYLHFWTCNVSIKRKFMLDAGMFDERFLGYEDILCGRRLNDHGMHLHFLPAARGQHLHQIKKEGIPAKGRWYGRWLYAFVEQLPEPAVKKRYGILSPDIGAITLAKRLVNRLGFRIVDNPLTFACLKMLGAAGARRSRVSDFYYFLIFRRNLLAGYYEAKRFARASRRPAIEVITAEWFDRGESK
jgi:glycosyltransferase involved in cell wall biosynthesis